MSNESSPRGFNSAILHLRSVAAHARLSASLVPDRSVSVMRPPSLPTGLEPRTSPFPNDTSNHPNGCAAMPVPSALTYDSFSVHVRMNDAALAVSSPIAFSASCSSGLSHRPASLSAAALVLRSSSSQSTPTSNAAAPGASAPHPGDASGVSEPQGFIPEVGGSIPGADVTARTTRRLVCETLNRIRLHAPPSPSDDEEEVASPAPTSLGLPCSPWANRRSAGWTLPPQYLARTHRISALLCVACRSAPSVMFAASDSSASRSDAGKHRAR